MLLVSLEFRKVLELNESADARRCRCGELLLLGNTLAGGKNNKNMSFCRYKNCQAKCKLWHLGCGILFWLAKLSKNVFKVKNIFKYCKIIFISPSKKKFLGIGITPVRYQHRLLYEVDSLDASFWLKSELQTK